tara:strand:+ start:509 stop:706 length:198 start_codon:yes stop_codon:yes gene_type:complete
MPRQRRVGEKPIEKYEVYHGYDQDVHTWFIEVQIPEIGTGSILKWFKSEEEYEKGLKKVLWRLYR